MILRNAVEKAESMVGKINLRYDISSDQLTEVHKYYQGRFEYGSALFRLGYMQGMKAAKAKRKKKESVL